MNRFGDPQSREEWDIQGTAKVTPKQLRMLNAVCGVLATQIVWHGRMRFDKDSWRHLLSGTAAGWKMVQGIDRGEGPPGFIMLGGSSLQLTKSQARDAITMGLHIGDHPDEQGLQCKPVRWTDVIYRALGFNPQELAA